MPARSLALLGIACLAVTLTACEKKAAPAPVAPPTPIPTATEIHVIEVPTPAPSPSDSTTVKVMQQTTPCGSEKLQNYLNLLPTPTAKDEIAKTVGHDRIRYVDLAQAKASASPASSRFTAGVGPDGRIKQFSCG